jgi:hypothetical protein
MVNPHLAADLDLFSRGGLEILKVIEEEDYNILRARPSLSKWRKLRLLAGAAVKRLTLAALPSRTATFPDTSVPL